MSDDFATSMSVPLDSDGFLRRECPTCERQFKWLITESEDQEEEPSEAEAYFCPYCAVEAPIDAWLTSEQVEHAQAVVASEVLGPELEKFGRRLGGAGRSSGSAISISVSHELPEKPEPLEEPDDMRRVEFGCHPDEPLKVEDGWDGGVHCLVCGDASSARPVAD